MGDNEQAMMNRIGRVRSRHCEPGGDSDAYELARWADDALAIVGAVEAWAETRTDKDGSDEGNADADLFSAWNRFLHDREKHGPSNG